MPMLFGSRNRQVRHTLKIDCQVVRERDFRLVADRVENLSGTGMLVTPADPVLTGERVIVSFRSPHSDEWFDFEATVARVVHGRRPGEYSRGLGLRFDAADEGTLAQLQGALGSSPVAPPGPSARQGRASGTPELLRKLSGSSRYGVAA
jgi:hypothetical protein